jgi:hypothetical protein
MSDELKKIIGAVFKLSGEIPLSRQEMINLFVFNLKFFDHDGARAAIDAAKGSGYLKILENGNMETTFDLSELELPPDYRPPDNLDISALSRPLVERLINTIMESGMEKKEAVRSITKISETKNLLFPAAAIFVGLERGIDMSPFFREVENFIIHGQG